MTFLGGTIGGTGSVTINGPGTWTGGRMANSGSTTFNGPMALSGSGVRDITERNVNFAGTTTWTNVAGVDGGDFRTGSGATLTNTGSWFDQTSFNARISNAFGGAQSTFVNAGTYTKSGLTATEIDIAFNNTATGTVRVNNGTLSLGGGGTQTGSFDVASGATLEFSGGTHTQSGLLTGGGTGRLLVSGGVVNSSGTNAFGGTLAFSGGTLNSNGSFTANGFAMSGGTQGGTGSVTINGPGTWTGGRMANSGSTTFNGPMALSGSGVRDITERNVNFAGTTTWTNVAGVDGGDFRTGSGATLTNTGSWFDQTSFNARISNAFGGAQSTFVNAGTYTKSGLTATEIDIAFNNTATGTVRVNNGTLSLGGGGTQTGSFDVASGATLEFSGGTHTQSGLLTGGGTGRLLVSGGVVNSSGTNAFGGTLAFSGGTLNSNGSFTANGFAMSGGTQGGTGSVTINGPGTWTGGRMANSGSTTFNGPMALSGSGVRDITERNVNFAGTTTWTNVAGVDGGDFRTGSGATLTNTGSWFDQTSFNARISNAFGGAQSTFVNAGTYTKSGLTATEIDIAFNNTATGTVRVNNGTLSLGGGGTQTGSFDVASGATLEFSGGTHTQSGLLTGGGTGRLLVSGGVVNSSGTNAFGGTLAFSGGTLNSNGSFTANGFAMSGGTQGGTGSVTINGPGTWTGGRMANSGSTTFNGPMALSGSGVRDITERNVNFAGTTTWTNVAGVDGGDFRTGSGATLTNTGSWFDQTSFNARISNAFGGAQSTFVNAGTYTKSGDSNTDLSGINYVNIGVTNVQRGVLELSTNFTNPGTLMGEGAFAASTITNNGRIQPGQTTGALTIDGNFVQSALGFFDVDLQNPENHDLLSISGFASLDGTLNLICFSECLFEAGQSFTILDAEAGGLTGTFADVVLSGFAFGDFDVIYDRANGDVLLNVNVATAPVPEPEQGAMLIAGLGLLITLSRRRNRQAA